MSKAENELDFRHLPEWLKKSVDQFGSNVGELDTKIEQRSKYLKNNLKCWIEFEELVDQINALLGTKLIYNLQLSHTFNIS